MINNFRSKIRRKLFGDSSTRYNFYSQGFHGDKYLIDIVDRLIQKVDFFIETGTNVGSTLAFVGKKYPELTCFSCEPDNDAYEKALINTKNYNNITIHNMGSIQFLNTIVRNNVNIEENNTLFWLDAHGYGFKWPLQYEIQFITKYFNKAYVLIDDFKVPGENQFQYDIYEGQVCSIEYIKDYLNPKISYSIVYPKYKIKTSRHHPLKGWGLIVFGYPNIANYLSLEKISIESFSPEV